MIDKSEYLRTAEDALTADPRTRFLVGELNLQNLPQPLSLEQQHAKISEYQLNTSVPDEIIISFETAKNLYLYAWFVFRFYPIAQQQALSTLEFALRTRFPEFVSQYQDKNRGKTPTLKTLLKYAVNEKILQNQHFEFHYEFAKNLAKKRYLFQMLDEMTKAGIDEFEFDDSQVKPSIEDFEHDWLANIIENIPKIRNDHAHGSSTLYHTVLNTFDLVRSMINQLYIGT